MQPHYGQSSRENVTLSSGTYHRPIVKKYPPPPRGIGVNGWFLFRHCQCNFSSLPLACGLTSTS